MVRIASSGDIANKWSRKSGNSQQDYESGVSQTSDSEQREAALDGAGNWEEGIQDAIANDSFRKGINASPKSWQRRSLQLGGSRYSTGVRESQDEYQAGFAPYRDEIESMSLSARGARGAPQNYDRVREVGDRLHQLRMER
jgi:hypothetical protein